MHSSVANFKEIRLMGDELIHADRRTESQTEGRTDITSKGDFRYYASAPKNSAFCSQSIRVLMCSAQFSQQTATTTLNSIMRLAFVSTRCQFFAS